MSVSINDTIRAAYDTGYHPTPVHVPYLLSQSIWVYQCGEPHGFAIHGLHWVRTLRLTPAADRNPFCSTLLYCHANLSTLQNAEN